MCFGTDLTGMCTCLNIQSLMLGHKIHVGCCFWQLASVLLLWYREVKIQTRNRLTFITLSRTDMLFAFGVYWDVFGFLFIASYSVYCCNVYVYVYVCLFMYINYHNICAIVRNFVRAPNLRWPELLARVQ
jgi:hypothetical protein